MSTQKELIFYAHQGRTVVDAFDVLLCEECDSEEAAQTLMESLASGVGQHP